jgi:hypothetical protein
MTNQDVTHFTTIDHTSDPGFFLRFLDAANAIPGVVEWKPVILDAVRLEGVTVSFRTILMDYDFLQLLLGGHIVPVSAGVLSEGEATSGGRTSLVPIAKGPSITASPHRSFRAQNCRTAAVYGGLWTGISWACDVAGALKFGARLLSARGVLGLVFWPPRPHSGSPQILEEAAYHGD